MISLDKHIINCVSNTKTSSMRKHTFPNFTKNFSNTVSPPTISKENVKPPVHLLQTPQNGPQNSESKEIQTDELNYNFHHEEALHFDGTYQSYQPGQELLSVEFNQLSVPEIPKIDKDIQTILLQSTKSMQTENSSQVQLQETLLTDFQIQVSPTISEAYNQTNVDQKNQIQQTSIQVSNQFVQVMQEISSQSQQTEIHCKQQAAQTIINNNQASAQTENPIQKSQSTQQTPILLDESSQTEIVKNSFSTEFGQQYDMPKPTVGNIETQTAVELTSVILQTDQLNISENSIQTSMKQNLQRLQTDSGFNQSRQKYLQTESELICSVPIQSQQDESYFEAQLLSSGTVPRDLEASPQLQSAVISSIRAQDGVRHQQDKETQYDIEMILNSQQRLRSDASSQCIENQTPLFLNQAQTAMVGHERLIDFYQDHQDDELSAKDQQIINLQKQVVDLLTELEKQQQSNNQLKELLQNPDSLNENTLIDNLQRQIYISSDAQVKITQLMSDSNSEVAHLKNQINQLYEEIDAMRNDQDEYIHQIDTLKKQIEDLNQMKKQEIEIINQDFEEKLQKKNMVIYELEAQFNIQGVNQRGDLQFLSEKQITPQGSDSSVSKGSQKSKQEKQAMLRHLKKMTSITAGIMSTKNDYQTLSVLGRLDPFQGSVNMLSCNSMDNNFHSQMPPQNK